MHSSLLINRRMESLPSKKCGQEFYEWFGTTCPVHSNAFNFYRSRETPSPFQAHDRGAKADSGYLSKAGLAKPTLMASTAVDSPTNISILRGSFWLNFLIYIQHTKAIEVFGLWLKRLGLVASLAYINKVSSYCEPYGSCFKALKIFVQEQRHESKKSKQCINFKFSIKRKKDQTIHCRSKDIDLEFQPSALVSFHTNPGASLQSQSEL